MLFIRPFYKFQINYFQLRRVVRSCTDADLSKRPSANEILDMLTKYLDPDDPLE